MMIQSPALRRLAAIGLAAVMSLALAACFVMPGKFASSLDLRKDGLYPDGAVIDAEGNPLDAFTALFSESSARLIMEQVRRIHTAFTPHANLIHRSDQCYQSSHVQLDTGQQHVQSS